MPSIPNQMEGAELERCQSHPRPIRHPRMVTTALWLMGGLIVVSTAPSSGRTTPATLPQADVQWSGSFAFQGRVYDGEVGDESRPLEGESVSLYGSGNPFPDPGPLIATTNGNADRSHGVTMDDLRGYHSIREDHLAGYESVGEERAVLSQYRQQEYRHNCTWVLRGGRQVSATPFTDTADGVSLDETRREQQLAVAGISAREPRDSGSLIVRVNEAWAPVAGEELGRRMVAVLD